MTSRLSRHRHTPPEPDLRAAKAALRATILARREAMAPDERARRSEAAVDRLLGLAEIAALKRVSAFWAIGAEIRTEGLIHRLHSSGHAVLLPRVNGLGKPLTFHRWEPGAALVEGRLGLLEPPAGEPELVPEAAITPLLAFDREGGRLGYGAGFYDRTFAALEARGWRPLRIGFAFACQEVAEVPTGPRDLDLDLVVTDEGVLRCQPPSA